MDEVVKVLLCDDSSVVRSIMDRLLRADPAIKVVAKAANGAEAVAAVQAGGIDVVVLDVEMPVMDGLTALPRLLAADRAVKVLMSSTLTTKGGKVALEALRLGAADFIPKPTAVGTVGTDETFRDELIAKVRGLGRQCHAYRARKAAGAQPAPARLPACRRLRLPCGPRRTSAPWCLASPARPAGRPPC